MLRWDYSKVGLEAMTAIMVVIAIVSIALRFWSRAVVLKGRYELDDWIALVALVFVLGLLALGFYLLHIGVGKHLDQLTGPQISEILKVFWIASFFFDFAMGFCRYSALAFYMRLFGLRRYTSRAWTISFCVVLFVTTAWILVSVFYTLFLCSPIRKTWEPSLPGQCVSALPTFLFITAVINVFTDVMMIVLPIPQIMALKMRPEKKRLIAATLLIGYSIPLICVGRVITIIYLRDKLLSDFSYAVIPLGFWLLAEPTISLFAISLPGIFQLIKRGWQHGPRALFTSRDFQSAYPERIHIYRGDPETRFLHFHDPLFEPVRSDGENVSSCARAPTDKSSRSPSEPQRDDVSYDDLPSLRPLEMIHVKTDIRVSYDT